MAPVVSVLKATVAAAAGEGEAAGIAEAPANADDDLTVPLLRPALTALAHLPRISRSCEPNIGRALAAFFLGSMSPDASPLMRPELLAIAAARGKRRGVCPIQMLDCSQDEVH